VLLVMLVLWGVIAPHGRGEHIIRWLPAPGNHKSQAPQRAVSDAHGGDAHEHTLMEEPSMNKPGPLGAVVPPRKRGN
jgi:hypothetical protein